MAAVYQEIVLAWNGEEYTVHPDFRMVQRIEARGISIMGVIERFQRGEPPASQVAEIIAHMLTSGGAKHVTPERVYAHLSASTDQKEWWRIYTAITLSFVPQEPDPGNSGGLADGAEHLTKETPEKPPTT